jgi:peptide/nickel transport system permease protein/oligopeptide transport system permease protein
VLIYSLRRLANLLPTLLIVSFIVFAMVRLIPGDPVTAIAGPDSTPELMAQIRESLGLNEPLLAQYGVYLRGLVTGDLGTSIRSRQPVWSEIGRRLPATLELAGAAMLLSLVVGVGLGVLAALRPGGTVDALARFVSLFGVSSPTFWTGLLFILAFAYYWRLFPISGRGGLEHLVLPAATVSLTSVAFISRLTRASLLEVLSQDYVRTARAKGTAGSRVVLKHALRNALMSPITVAGLEFGRLLSGVIVIEIIFSWPGTGRLLVNAIQFRDFPVIQGLVLVYALIFALVNLAVDLVYAALDPRIALR